MSAENKILDIALSRRDLLRFGTAATGLAVVAATNPLSTGSVEAAAYTSPFGKSKILGIESISTNIVYRDPHVKEIVRNSLNISPHRFTESNAEMILRQRPAWSSKNWKPIFDETAESRGIPTLHAPWWSAHVYEILGGEGDVWQQAQKKAEFVRRNHPEAKDYAGYCTWLACAQLLEEEPKVYEGENFAGATDTQTIRWLKEGLLIIKHAGDILVPVPPTREVFMTLMEMGLPTIIDAPEGEGVGNWFRATQGISEDGRQVRATNFGYEDKDFLLSSVVSAWVVYPADSQDEFALGIREATSSWRYNTDRHFIDQQVSAR